MFNTVNVILDDVTDVLAQSGVNALEPKWGNSIVPRAQMWAYNLIVARLAARGYLITQITGWDLGAVAERELAIYRALLAGGMLQNAPAELIKCYGDWLEELKTCIITAGGALQSPQGAVGVPNSGAFDTSSDIFVWPPNDGSAPLPAAELGDPTRF